MPQIRVRRQQQLFEEPPAVPVVRLPPDVRQQLRQALVQWMQTLAKVKTTAWKAVAVVTDYKSCSGRRPAQWAPHQAGFKK